ncbi:MAG TPA: 3-methyl-2-oxobutanoate hydroxymethyltransferase [Chthoniobacterales bacterium]|jgi:3-methyl-2-oxobutanoate hydroxymethyltransferase|nr:3-methyl-2-oxobutanoate hydroxymethyltransferase [Chthoniobacterales bacterium]
MIDLKNRYIELKKARKALVALTAYDYPMARLLDENGVDLILVGDSLGMVVLGYPDTTEVSLEDMLHHTRAVARGVKTAIVVSDLPKGSYDNLDLALTNAQALIAAGAKAVKLEGGEERAQTISALVEAGIPVFAHIGMLPQHIREEGGYKIKGRTPQQADQLLKDALAVEAAGAFAVVLELVTPPLALELSQALMIPTIGIGSGADCDGQIRVLHDVIGLYPWFRPKFVEPKANVASIIGDAVKAYAEDVRRSPLS